jgi:hypothetical protein
MGIEREESQALKHSGKGLCQTLRVRLREARHANVLEMKAVLLGER